MRILLYAKQNSVPGRKLKEIVQTLVPEEEIKFCHGMENLSQSLLEPGINPPIAVLLADSKKELSEILSIRDLFGNKRIILVLPDREKETISKGHTLYPRFLTYADSDFWGVSAVLEKMLDFYT